MSENNRFTNDFPLSDVFLPYIALGWYISTRGVKMLISDFTEIELDLFRRTCNFVGFERDVFELRSKGVPLEQVAERVNMSVDGVKKISRKVNAKIARVGTLLRH